MREICVQIKNKVHHVNQLVGREKITIKLYNVHTTYIVLVQCNCTITIANVTLFPGTRGIVLLMRLYFQVLDELCC